jgi:signal transduction histidine kinase/CheY-like chemotaxis protein
MLKVCFWLRFFYLSMACVAHASAAAAVVDVSADITSLVPFVEVCEDPESRLSRADVEQGACAFEAANSGTMSKGFTASNWWLRVRLVNSKTEPIIRWISVGHPKISLVNLYSRDAGGSLWLEQKSGLMIPSSQRPVLATTPVLPVTLQPGKVTDLLVSVRSISAIDLTMYAWDSHKYMSSYQKMQLAHTVALGGLLLTGLFALAIFFQFKDRTFLYYGLAMWCEIGVELVNSGVWPQYLWPEGQPFFLEILPLCVAGAVIGFTLFLHSFIGNLKRFPVTLHLFHASVAVLLSALFWAVAIQYRQGGLIWSLSVVVMLFFSLALITQAAWQGSRQAKMLMITTSAICLLELFRLGVTLGLNSITITMIAGAPWAFVLTAPAVLAGISLHSRELHEKYLLERKTTEIRSQLLARVGHDLRAPLSTILGLSRLLEANSPRTTPREAGIAIGNSGKLLLRQIDDLLDLARLDVGHIRLRPQPIVLATWLAELRVSADLITSQAGNQFRVQAEDLQQVFLADADRLNQVLTNLLINANRATTHGLITLACSAQAVDPDQVQLQFSVTDTGVGIAPSDQARIFEPFEQCGYKKQADGIGLGLAIVRNLVELMGGRIALESAPGEGSRFEFSIVCPRIAQAHAGALSPNATLALPNWQSAQNNGRHILIADDSEEDRMLMRDILLRAGYQVSLADGAMSAMAVNDLKLDAVITDQYMTDGDGWQVLEHFKKGPAAPLVILVSQAQFRPPIGWNNQQPFDAMLSKPVSAESVIDALETVLRQHKVSRPPEPRIAELRKLIQAGEVTLIDQWAQSIKVTEPLCSHYANAIRDALIKLDFDRLRTLSAPESK